MSDNIALNLLAIIIVGFIWIWGIVEEGLK